MGCSSEIFLTKNFVPKEEWLNLFNIVSKYNGYSKKWTLKIIINQKNIQFFIKTKCKLPVIVSDLEAFLFKEEKDESINDYYITTPVFFDIGCNLFDLCNYTKIKKLGTLKYITIKVRRIGEDRFLTKTHLYTEKEGKLIKTRLILGLPFNILNLDFDKNKSYVKRNVPKYLNISKITHLLQSDKQGSIFEIDTFPYLDGNFYLSNNNYDFNKHSLVLGSSGSGKSKFLSLFINNIYKKSANDFKIIMIDPHSAIEDDIGGLGKVIDFKTIEDSIDLFSSNTDDLMVSTELSLELLKSIISDQYNSKVERVLRHAIYLLLAKKEFNFNNLKKIILNIEYRNELIREMKSQIPESIIYFFLNDFNDLKTKSYGEAISPIIAFIDEMQMLPIFNESNIDNKLEDVINKEFLTLFSLNRLTLGDKVTKTISGLIMQQVLTLIQRKIIKEHIIFIIDEVAVVENPILCRFLAEARKYNLSLILAGQYFNQISHNLKEAILANVINYYIFRISRDDANIIVDNLDMKVQEDTKDNKISLISKLNNRECIIRISNNGLLLPAFKGKTLDFESIPRIKNKLPLNNNLNEEIFPKKENIFKIDSNIKVQDIFNFEAKIKEGKNL